MTLFTKTRAAVHFLHTVLCNILSLAERRHELGKRFFQRIIKDKSNVLFKLLPAKRDVQLTTRLRRARQYPSIFMHGLIVIKTPLFYLD